MPFQELEKSEMKISYRLSCPHLIANMRLKKPLKVFGDKVTRTGSFLLQTTAPPMKRGA